MAVDFIDGKTTSDLQVFGSGYLGKKATYALKKLGFNVTAALDNSESVQGGVLWGDVPIIAPQDGDRNITVVLCFMKDGIKKEVRKQCEDLAYDIVVDLDPDRLQRFLENLTDREYLEMMYYCFHGSMLNLNNPQKLNEKLQWLKLHDRNPLYVTLGDKYKVRSFLAKRFGEEYLIPLLYMTYDYNDIIDINIPDEHCAIKSNCWSGDVELIRSKEGLDCKRLRDKFKDIFESDWSKSGREWWYSRMKPCVIIEKLLETKEGKLPNDYKLHFFNGKLQFIYCSIDREGDNYRKIYSPEWDEMPFSWNGEGTPPDSTKPNISRPENYELMLKMGADIAKDIPYVRVDYYEVDGKLYFGEVTLSHGAGFDRFVPEEYDLIYGEKLSLPIMKGENIKNYLETFKEYTVPSHDIWSIQENERERILKLDWNESTVEPSPSVVKRIRELSVNGQYYQYYPNTNNKILRKKIADYVNVGEENIQVFPSTDSAHEYLAKVWIRKGDKCGILWPAYDNFRATMELADATITFCEPKGFVFDEKSLYRFLDLETPKLFYICNPNNPTGEQLPVDAIERIVNRYPEILFVIDEAYSEFSGISSVDLVKKYGNVVISRTFSKAFGLANFRIGYLVSSVDNIRLLTAVRNGKNISTFAQEAALAALEDIGYMQNYVDDVTAARNEFVIEVRKMSYIKKVYDSEANFVMIELPDYVSKDKFIEYLLNNNIYVRDIGQTRYIREHCCRITVGTRQQMKTVIDVMRGFDD